MYNAKQLNEFNSKMQGLRSDKLYARQQVHTAVSSESSAADRAECADTLYYRCSIAM